MTGNDCATAKPMGEQAINTKSRLTWHTIDSHSTSRDLLSSDAMHEAASPLHLCKEMLQEFCHWGELQILDN